MKIKSSSEGNIMSDTEPEFGGYVNGIRLGGKVYKLRCEVVEIYPMTCPKCGGHVELKYGQGKCNYCDTHYTTQFKIVESN